MTDDKGMTKHEAQNDVQIYPRAVLDPGTKLVHMLSASPLCKGERIEVRGSEKHTTNQPSPCPLPLKGRGDRDSSLEVYFASYVRRI